MESFLRVLTACFLGLAAEATSCTNQCETEFVKCVRFHTAQGTTSPYDRCESGLGTDPILQREGCVAGCTISQATSSQARANEAGGDQSVKPGETTSCTSNCEKEFLKCVEFHSKKATMYPYERCELNLGTDPVLQRAGCFAGCTISEVTSIAAEEILEEEINEEGRSSNTATETPSSPALCTTANRGRCDCGNLNGVSGMMTYTWWIGTEQRCYSVYTPTSTYNGNANTNGMMPVLLWLQCYARDRIDTMGQSMFSNANRFGVYLAYASSPRGSWSWNTAECNDQNPSACNDFNGGTDHTYFEDLLTHLTTSAPNHDARQVFAFGFSQNGMGSGYIGTCFPQKVAGVWRGGAGMFIKGESGPIPPGGEGSCANCKYWPSYTCFQGVGNAPLRDCAQTYDNDPIAAQDANVNQPRALYSMSLIEGGDVRALVFSPTSRISGKHSPPQNEIDWVVGCVGMRDEAGQCPPTCESALQSCVLGGSTYAECLGIEASSSGQASVTSACPTGCTPTYAMLQTSEVPALYATIPNTFGPQLATAIPSTRPANSICENGGAPATAPAPAALALALATVPAPAPATAPVIASPTPATASQAGMTASNSSSSSPAPSSGNHTALAPAPAHDELSASNAAVASQTTRFMCSLRIFPTSLLAFGLSIGL